MSRAFVKEGDNALDPLPDIPLSPHPNYVTPNGLALLRSRLAQTQAELARLRGRAERLDKLPEAAAERDIRYLEARLRTAILRDPAALPQTEMAFGLVATLRDEQGNIHRYQITGEDEANPAQGRIAPFAPLARALIGARVGDVVEWPRPGGPLTLTVLRIDPP